MVESLIMGESIGKIPSWKLANGQITIDKTSFLLSRVDLEIKRRVWKIIQYSPGLEIDLARYNYHGCFPSKEEAMNVMSKLSDSFEKAKFL